MGVLVIAEAGVNHNGKLDLALELCDAAKKSGADVVKFQTWRTELLLTKDVAQAEYQSENTGIVESQFDMLKKLELSYDDFREIKRHCDEIGIVFASTADEPDSLDFLIELGIPFIKIGSGEIGNIPYLRYMGSKGLPIILSTGMSTLDDVRISVEALKTAGAEDITLLHCTTNYPCEYENVNLKAMNTLAEEFGLKVGYSDHTEGIEVSISAVALGACVIEKHFTLDRNMEGPDQLSSTEPKEFLCLVNSIRNVEKCLGDGIKNPTTEEVEISKVVKKRIVCKRNIKKGQMIMESDICVKRSNSGAPASQWDKIVGMVAQCDYFEDEGIDIN